MMAIEASDGLVARSTHIFVLTSFAIAQPTFDLLGRNAAFFVAHRATPLQMWTFAAGVLLIPAVLLAGVVVLTGWLQGRLARWVQAAIVGSLFALALVPPSVRPLHLRTIFWVPLFLMVIAIGAAAYARLEGLRQYIAWGLIAPFAFLVMFVFFSPVNKLFFPPKPPPPMNVQIQDETPVVLMVFDEMALGTILTPEGKIDERRFPNFARLADEGTWYPQATTVADATVWALPALHTGSLPDVHDLPSNVDYPRNLFTLLHPAYEIRASEYLTRLCPPDVCQTAIADADEGVLFKDALTVFLHSVLPPGLSSRWLPSIDGRWAGFGTENEDQLAELAAEQLRRGSPMDAETFQALAGRDSTSDPLTSFDRMSEQLPRDDETPGVLWYLHLGTPHIPYFHLPPELTYFGQSSIPGLVVEGGSHWRDEVNLVNQALQRYMLQSQFADHLLGRALDRLESAGVFSDALVVVLSDHGVSFAPGERRRDLGPATQDELLPIPLFIKYPNQRGGTVDERNAEIIDVLPTIADVLGIELPWEATGSSLLEEEDGSQRQAVSYATGELFAVPEDLDRLLLSRLIREEFGPWRRDFDLYAPARYADLIGRSPRDLPRGNEYQGLTFELENPSLYEGLEPESGFVPAFVTGKLGGSGAREDMPLLLVVNGTAAGTGVSFSEGSTIRFSGMTAPELFERGRNQVDLYAIDDDGRVHPIQRTDSGYKVSFDSDGNLISVVTPGGETLPAVEGSIAGEVNGVTLKEVYLRVFGWAVDVGGKRAPSTFLIMHRGEVIRVASTTASPDMVEAYGEAFHDVRFHEELPLEEVGSLDELVVVALFEHGASIIPDD